MMAVREKLAAPRLVFQDTTAATSELHSTSTCSSAGIHGAGGRGTAANSQNKNKRSGALFRPNADVYLSSGRRPCCRSCCGLGPEL